MTTTTTQTTVLERFLRYVRIDTQSSGESKSVPSTPGQIVLLDLLVDELKALGLADARRLEEKCVIATIPATTKKTVPVVGFLAHVDTSPEASGANVKPIVHRQWNGADLVLPDDPNVVLRAAGHAALRAQIGNDLVTASGTTLLGADDKAGVAEIMAAAEYMVRHPEIAHGPIRIGFTTDEEVGRGADQFDVAAFDAFCAYTLDGDDLGKLDTETFSADSVSVQFKGFVTHPGTAKGQMINSVKVAADFIARLPRDGVSPETTSDREGFVHPLDIDAAVDRTTVRFIIRDFETPGLAEKEAMLERLARETVAAWPGSSMSFKVTQSYRNFREVLDRHPAIVENANEAIRRAGLTPVSGAIRGGTDGSRLSFMGLPTPNLFTGGHNYHSTVEWVSVQDMEKAVEVIVQLARVWEERA